MNPTVSLRRILPKSLMCHCRVRVSSVLKSWSWTYTSECVSRFISRLLPAFV